MASYGRAHIHLKAQDVETSVRWYCHVLGGQITQKSMFRGSEEYEIDINGTAIVVSGELEDELPLPVALHPRFGLDHFGFRVDDMDAAVGDLKAKGIPFVEEPWTIRPGLRLACIEAPDRVRIELIELRQQS